MFGYLEVPCSCPIANEQHRLLIVGDFGGSVGGGIFKKVITSDDQYRTMD
jgi:hypothetical protein